MQESENGTGGDDVTLYMSSYFKKRTLESIRCSQNSWTWSNQEPYPTMKKRRGGGIPGWAYSRYSRDKTGPDGRSQIVPQILTLVIHEASAELLEASSVAHGPQRAVELVVGHCQVLRVASHVDHLEDKHPLRAWTRVLLIQITVNTQNDWTKISWCQGCLKQRFYWWSLDWHHVELGLILLSVWFVWTVTPYNTTGVCCTRGSSSALKMHLTIRHLFYGNLR